MNDFPPDTSNFSTPSKVSLFDSLWIVLLLLMLFVKIQLSVSRHKNFRTIQPRRKTPNNNNQLKITRKKQSNYVNLN